MKKLLLSLSIACLGLAAQAQDFKPAKGNVTTEFGLTGGLNDAKFELDNALLRFRYFVKSDLAIRAGFSINTKNDTENVYGLPNTPEADKVGYIKNNSTDFMINLGVEKHFAGTDRLSPYVGADFLIGNSSRSASTENSDGSDYVEGDHIEIKGMNNLGGGTPEISSFNIGLRAVIGADYYIAKHLYLGAEAGLGFISNKGGKVTITETSGGVTDTQTVKSAGKNLGINTSVVSAIRIGFVF